MIYQSTMILEHVKDRHSKASNYCLLILILIRQIQNIQNMKTSSQCFLLFLLFAVAEMQCSIPAGCENYSVSQLKCTSCQQNYLLINNICINTFSSSPIISGVASVQQYNSNSASSPLYGITSNSAITLNPTQFASQSTISQTASQQSTSSEGSAAQIFIPWYNNQQAINAGNQNMQQQQQQPIQTPSSMTVNTNSISSNGNYTDYNCKTPDYLNSICNQCYSFYYFNTTQGKCCTVDPLCKGYTLQNQCTSCYSGYSLINGRCNLNSGSTASSGASSISTQLTISGGTQTISSVTTNNDNNCANYTNNVCAKCYQGFYFNATLNKCTQLNQKCKTATSNNQCTSCYGGYVLNTVIGDCIAQTPASTSTSSSSAASSASSSSSSQIASSTQSNQQSTGISTASGSTSNSQFITLNGFLYQINSQGQIFGPLSLPSSSSQNIYSSTVVADPAQSTSTSSQSTSSSQAQNPASKCYDRQVLLNGICFDVNPQCYKWDNTGACTDCYKGYHLSNGNCV